MTLSPPVHLMRLVPAELFANDINQRYVSTVPMDLEHASLIANVAWAIAEMSAVLARSDLSGRRSRFGESNWQRPRVIRMCG